MKINLGEINREIVDSFTGYGNGNGDLLWPRQWTFEFHKRCKISLLFERLKTCQKRTMRWSQSINEYLEWNRSYKWSLLKHFRFWTHNFVGQGIIYLPYRHKIKALELRGWGMGAIYVNNISSTRMDHKAFVLVYVSVWRYNFRHCLKWAS
jgi:hypothetical protein